MPKQTAGASKTYHHGDLRNALIAEGRRLVAEKGPYEFSMRDVARSVGVSSAAPSRHFDGKDTLLAVIAADGFHELALERRQIDEEIDDPALKAYRMMDSYVRFAAREPGLFELMVGARVINQREDLPEYLRAATESFEYFASAVRDFAREKGWEERDLAGAVHAAWAVEHGLARLIIVNRLPFPGYQADVQEITQFAIALLLSGLSAGPAELARVTSQLP